MHRCQRWGGSLLFSWWWSGHEGVWCCQLWHDKYAEDGVSWAVICACDKLFPRVTRLFFSTKLPARPVWVDLQSRWCHFHSRLLRKVNWEDLCLWWTRKERAPPRLRQHALLAALPNPPECQIQSHRLCWQIRNAGILDWTPKWIQVPKTRGLGIQNRHRLVWICKTQNLSHQPRLLFWREENGHHGFWQESQNLPFPNGKTDESVRWIADCKSSLGCLRPRVVYCWARFTAALCVRCSQSCSRWGSSCPTWSSGGEWLWRGSWRRWTVSAWQTSSLMRPATSFSTGRCWASRSSMWRPTGEFVCSSRSPWRQTGGKRVLRTDSSFK